MKITDYNKLNNSPAVYKITNPVGQIYIGSTKHLRIRMYAHGRGKDKGTRKLYDSMNKYGVNNHTLEILCDDFEGKNIKEVEHNYIEQYAAHRNGLNTTSSAKGGVPKGTQSPNKGRKMSDEQKSKLREIHKRLYKENGQKESGIATRFKKGSMVGIGTRFKKGRIPWSKGLTLSEEVRGKISKSLKGNTSHKGKFKYIPEFANDENDISKKVQAHRFANITSDWHKQCNRLAVQITNARYRSKKTKTSSDF